MKRRYLATLVIGTMLMTALSGCVSEKKVTNTPEPSSLDVETLREINNLLNNDYTEEALNEFQEHMNKAVLNNDNEELRKALKVLMKEGYVVDIGKPGPTCIYKEHNNDHHS